MQHVIDEALMKTALTRRLVLMGFARSQVSEWVNGKVVPSLANAARIEAVLGIPAAVWAERVPLKEMWAHLSARSD